MLRQTLADALKEAMKAKDQRTVATVRLILAALKDRDIAARADGRPEGLSDEAILQMLSTMIRQRRESIELYKKGGREDLARQEEEEIAVIERFLPPRLSDEEMARAVKQAIEEMGATGLKDMGRIMAALKANYAGRMDFAKASGLVRQYLS
ncbi:MAG: GatB/YqeY domain-containing protein [Alphaproteobacteria bacterium]